MNSKSKTIRDPIHGDIKLEGLFLELIEAPEIQRLYDIKQLGFAHLVFPGAHHTRLEHSLGVYHMASKAADQLNLDEDEKETVKCAAFLHDIGHGPFSHTLEHILRDTLNADHVDLTEKLIFGENSIFSNMEKEYIQSPSVFEILNNHKIDRKEISDIIRGKKDKKKYLGQLLNSPVDVDQIDYLIRDSYYTGVAYGMIDVERFLQTLLINNNQLAVSKKGVGALENILMARNLMYSSVYFHKTVRIAELMLAKAIEMINDVNPFDFFKMTDGEIISDLKNRGNFQYEIATRLKFRKLFKQAFTKSISTIDAESYETIKKLEKLDFRREKESEFEEVLNIPSGHVIIDIPSYELMKAEPRIKQTNIPIIYNEFVKSLDDFTPVAKAIRSREIPDWTLMIITDEKYKNLVFKNTEKILFN
jgi:HD superfamily phosphohydrolase